MEDPVGTGIPAASPAPRGRGGVTFRSVIIGLIATVLIDLWVHYAELVLGGMRGHTAIVNTSIPVGAFNVLFALVGLNILLARLSPRLKLSQAEMLTIYVMCAVSTVLSSSAGLHFLIPTITAAHYFATVDNGWARLFHGFIPKWAAQTDPMALKGFYEGNATLELSRWAVQIGVWSAFLLVFACATLCLTLILRKQWIEREHLPFPTVTLPLELTRDSAPILRDPLFWGALIVTFAIACQNTLSLNYPNFPALNLRAYNISTASLSPPFNAIGTLPVTFFPFAIGIGYLLSTEVVFSCWFFYLFSKAQAVFGAALGWTNGPVTGVQSAFPYLAYQGAGAFLGLAVASIWISRQHFKTVFKSAFCFDKDAAPDPDQKGYKVAVFGLLACILAMTAFAVALGANPLIAVLFVVLVLVYLMAATRIRAETGNAWPVGPEVDAFRLLMTVGGTAAFHTADLTALTYLRAATAGQDFRGVCMPHQLDGFKIADATGIKPGKLAWAMVLAIAIGTVVSFIIALFIWTKYGALAKTDVWRSLKGRSSFDLLKGWLQNPTKPDPGGMMGIAAGAGFTVLLSYLRMQYVWWPFHPVGYCMSNTFMAYNSWMPFFIAWLSKVIITRAGGMRLYRRAMPFFLGLIAGDFLGGGLTTLIGCFSKISVYPVNW